MSFKPGDTIVLDIERLSETDMKHHDEPNRLVIWGRFGYKSSWRDAAFKPLLFTYLCEHSPQDGHCIIVEIVTGQMHTMIHPDMFRLATRDEC